MRQIASSLFSTGIKYTYLAVIKFNVLFSKFSLYIVCLSEYKLDIFSLKLPDYELSCIDIVKTSTYSRFHSG